MWGSVAFALSGNRFQCLKKGTHKFGWATSKNSFNSRFENGSQRTTRIWAPLCHNLILLKPITTKLPFESDTCQEVEIPAGRPLKSPPHLRFYRPTTLQAPLGLTATDTPPGARWQGAPAPERSGCGLRRCAQTGWCSPLKWIFLTIGFGPLKAVVVPLVPSGIRTLFWLDFPCHGNEKELQKPL